MLQIDFLKISETKFHLLFYDERVKENSSVNIVALNSACFRVSTFYNTAELAATVL